MKSPHHTDKTTPPSTNPPAQLTPAAVYDTALEAALRSSRFAPRRLPLPPHWAWLLGKLAKTHGVAEPYCLLRYLQHVMSAATPSADCLQIVLANLGPVLKANVNGLPAAEGKMLAQVKRNVYRLLFCAFESYKLLSEEAPTGVAQVPTGVPTGQPVPSPALYLAVELFDLLHNPSSQARGQPSSSYCSHC